MVRKSSTQFIITVFYSGLAVAINYLILFILTPYITENIGTEAYGFVSLAKNFANYATILTIALNSFSSRFISIEYHRGNTEKANQYYSSVFLANLMLGAMILSIASVFIIYIQYFLRISEELIFDVKILFALAFVNFLLISSGTAFAAASYIKNRLDLASLFKAISYIAEAVFLIGVFYFFQPKVYYVGLGIIFSSTIIVASNFWLTRRITPDLRLNRKLFAWTAVKDLVVNGIWNSFNSLGNTLNTGLDLLICNLILSTLAMGQLAIVKTISVIFSTLFQLLSQPFQPLILKTYALSDMGKVVDIFKIGIKVCGLFSNIAFAGFVSYGMIYYKLWTPSQDIELLYYLTIVTIFAGIIEGAVYPLYYTYTLTMKNKIPCIVTIAGGSLKVGMVFLFIQFTDLGIYAVVGTTTIISWVINFIFNPIYAANSLGISKFTFFPILLRHILSCLTMTIAFRAISAVIYPEGWVGLIASLLLCFCVGSGIHMLFMVDKENFAQIRRRRA